MRKPLRMKKKSIPKKTVATALDEALIEEIVPARP